MFLWLLNLGQFLSVLNLVLFLLVGKQPVFLLFISIGFCLMIAAYVIHAFIPVEKNHLWELVYPELLDINGSYDKKERNMNRWRFIYCLNLFCLYLSLMLYIIIDIPVFLYLAGCFGCLYFFLIFIQAKLNLFLFTPNWNLIYPQLYYMEEDTFVDGTPENEMENEQSIRNELMRQELSLEEKNAFLLVYNQIFDLIKKSENE